ncbi:hypothetical protein F2Z20_20300, partial [Bacteroides finegoldii]
CNFTLVGTGGPAPWRWPFPDRRVFRKKIMRDTVYFIVPKISDDKAYRTLSSLNFYLYVFKVIDYRYLYVILL